MFSVFRLLAKSPIRLSQRNVMDIYPCAITDHVIGVDLGTTNTRVAVMKNGRIKVIENDIGLRKTPSVVAFTEAGGRLIGAEAKRQAGSNPENTINGVKRIVGRKFDDVQKDLTDVPYKIVKAENGDAWIESRGIGYSPSQITAYLLMKMKEAAESYLGDYVHHAVITVPSHFSESQSEAMHDAGKIAGLKVLRVMSEPGAALYAYGLVKAREHSNESENGIFAIYDFGGGKFNISIYEMQNGIGICESIFTDKTLGGEEFDNRLLCFLVDTFKMEEDIDLSDYPEAMQRVREAAEKAKCDLSSVTETCINLPNIIIDASGFKHMIVKISREQFENLVDDLLERTIKLSEKAVVAVGFSSVKEILFIGGMSRMPKIQELLKKHFGRQPKKGINPEEVVVRGAAFHGAALSGKVPEFARH